jgi:hypothetical protein
MVNIAFPALNAIDSWLALLLPDLVRVLLWGALSGAAAMLLYAWVSDQKTLAALKQRARAMRRSLLDPALDRESYMRLTRENLSVSFRLLGKSFGPAIVSSVPVLIVMLWLAFAQSYARPAVGTSIPVNFLPPSTAAVKVGPPALLHRTSDGVRFTIAPEPQPVDISDATGNIYDGVPDDPPFPVIHKRQWWNILIGNEAGYLAPSATIDEVHFDFPVKRLVAEVPQWMATWELPYFAALILVAVALKVGFKIE